ncbi:Rhomboid-related protein 3 [Cyphomyrmex costatus]|uniref:Rhomboid-related protein 3 n=1 Tax=Cyphomyrmex costatus TaxID=456900 RepID=A0A195D4W4_9HYME|nr:Rhomboid-related protein 3 [Cyphomyrmex costatus]
MIIVTAGDWRLGNPITWKSGLNSPGGNVTCVSVCMGNTHCDLLKIPLEFGEMWPSSFHHRVNAFQKHYITKVVCRENSLKEVTNGCAAIYEYSSCQYADNAIAAQCFSLQKYIASTMRYAEQMVRMIGDEFLTEERDRKYYADHYTCCPPPLFIILITLVEPTQAIDKRLDVSLMNRTVDLMALLNWQNFRSSGWQNLPAVLSDILSAVSP